MTWLRKFSHEITLNLDSNNLQTNCVVLKIRDTNFNTITRRSLLTKKTKDENIIFSEAREILKSLTEILNRGVRLLGISVTNLEAETYQETNLFSTL